VQDDQRLPPEPNSAPAAPDPPPAVPYLDYTSRPPRRPADDPVADFLHFVTGFAVYVSLVVMMKLLAVRYRWPIDAICGTCILLIIISFGIAGWLAGSLGWRGAMAGVIVGLVISLLVSALILKEG
jgi:hypothetical protein